MIKITYGHHHWGKEYPPCIRKAISGTFLINFFLDIYISVVCQIVCIFKDKSNGDDDNDADDDDDEDDDEKKSIKKKINLIFKKKPSWGHSQIKVSSNVSKPYLANSTTLFKPTLGHDQLLWLPLVS